MPQIHYIDYGNRAVVNMQQLSLIPENDPRFKGLLQIPALALQCTLSQIAPNVMRYPSGEWGEDCCQWYIMLYNYVFNYR